MPRNQSPVHISSATDMPVPGITKNFREATALRPTPRSDRHRLKKMPVLPTQALCLFQCMERMTRLSASSDWQRKPAEAEADLPALEARWSVHAPMSKREGLAPIQARQVCRGLRTTVRGPGGHSGPALAIQNRHRNACRHGADPTPREIQNEFQACHHRFQPLCVRASCHSVRYSTDLRPRRPRRQIRLPRRTKISFRRRRCHRRQKLTPQSSHRRIPKTRT